jgi:hypothetical protein
MATDYRQDFPDTVRVWDEICGTSSTLRFCLCHFYNTYDTSPTVCYYEKKTRPATRGYGSCHELCPSTYKQLLLPELLMRHGRSRTCSFTMLVPIESRTSTHSSRSESFARITHSSSSSLYLSWNAPVVSLNLFAISSSKLYQPIDSRNLNRTVSPLYVALTVSAGLVLSLRARPGFPLKVG